MEAYRGAGMNAEVEADLGMEKLEAEHAYGGLVREVFQQFGIAKVDGVMLRFAGAYQRDDTGDVDAVEVVMRGRHTEIDPGSSKAGGDTEFKVKSGLTYYKLTINGDVVVEIDVLNMIENVNGEDRLAQQRRAIGL
jgi:P2 family phage contractile tail tube protein